MNVEKLFTSILKDTPVWFRISLSIVLAIAVFISPELLENQTSSTVPSSPSGEIQGIQSESTYTVTDVVDGDTIKILDKDEIKIIRLVNINTPESVHPKKEVECLGIESSQRMKELVLNQQVLLETDPTQQDTDRYGRLLRFVFLQKENKRIDVGLTLISEGFAYSSPYGTAPHPYFDQYESAQESAQENSLGLWNKTICQ